MFITLPFDLQKHSHSSKRLEQQLLRLLQHSQYQPLNEKQLSGKLKIQVGQRTFFQRLLHELELSGKIARIKGDRWVLAQEAGLVSGVIQLNQKGFAFVITEGEEQDIFIPAEDTSVAMHMDVVLVRLSQERKTGKREGRVIRILKRHRDHLVGTLQRTGLFWVVVPDDPRYRNNIYVPEPSEGYGEHGDKVVVRLFEWKSRHLNPEGVVVKRLGKVTDPGVDILSIVAKHDLQTDFGSEIIADVARFRARKSVPLEGDREDLRNQFVITIDPDTAKDFDDAISLRVLQGQNIEVGIHIADVAHYVQRGGKLDEEAKQRGNSTYLVDRVIPMLPEELSNDLCSLVPNQDRLTRSAFVTLNSKGQVVSSRIARTVICSQHRLTYGEAYSRLKRPPRDDLDQFLHLAWQTASKLRSIRMKQGALDLDMPEVKTHLDELGRPVRLERIENDESHQLIEEFMLLANDVVAATLKAKRVPTLYRIHQEPDRMKLMELRRELAQRGVKVGDLSDRREMQRFTQLVRTHPQAHSLKLELLKSLKRAVYSPEPLGHFGLAKSNYTHFTSPIRRYADLIVHRAFDGGKRMTNLELSEIAKHLSITERTSAEAEQESKRTKLFQYFASQIDKRPPEVFQACITDVQNYGFFVELTESLVSGLVHLSALKDDFYMLDSAQKMVRGKRTRRTFKQGDIINLQVERVDEFKRQIDFKPV